jgi:hypothetical protein
MKECLVVKTHFSLPEAGEEKKPPARIARWRP